MRWRHLEQRQAGSSCFNDLPSAHPLGHAVSDSLEASRCSAFGVFLMCGQPACHRPRLWITVQRP